MDEGGTLGDEPTAVPVRATVAFRPDTELTVSHPDKLPGVVGRNCTLIAHVVPAASAVGHVVVVGKSAVSELDKPMVSAVVVISVTVVVAAVAPTDVCGNVTSAVLTLSAGVGALESLLQAAQSITNKGHVKIKSTDEDLVTMVARSRRRATQCPPKMPSCRHVAFSEQDDSSTRVSESFDASLCTFLRRATASVILSGEFFL